jgi:hypothetical protein
MPGRHGGVGAPASYPWPIMTSRPRVRLVRPPSWRWITWWTSQPAVGWSQPRGCWHVWSPSVTRRRRCTGTSSVCPTSSGSDGAFSPLSSAFRRRNEATPPGPETICRILPRIRRSSSTSAAVLRRGPLRRPRGPVLLDPPVLQRRVGAQSAQVGEENVNRALTGCPSRFGSRSGGQEAAHAAAVICVMND